MFFKSNKPCSLPCWLVFLLNRDLFQWLVLQTRSSSQIVACSFWSYFCHCDRLQKTMSVYLFIKWLFSQSENAFYHSYFIIISSRPYIVVISFSECFSSLKRFSDFLANCLSSFCLIICVNSKSEVIGPSVTFQCVISHQRIFKDPLVKISPELWYNLDFSPATPLKYQCFTQCVQ